MCLKSKSKNYIINYTRKTTWKKKIAELFNDDVKQFMIIREIITSNQHNFVFMSSANSIHMCGLNNKFISPFKNY